ncbi:MAG: cyclase family protein [Hyphomonadaceae bacterium]
MGAIRMQTIAAAAIVSALFAGAVAAQDNEAVAPPPSPFGAEDSIGASNHLSPEGARRAARLVRTGQVYALGVVTGRQTPVGPGRSYSIAVLPIDDGGGSPMGENQVTGHDDILMTNVGIGTQLDGFAHIGANRVHYNGVHARDLYRPDGVVRFGTENIPPTATRGVLLDMTRQFDQNPVAAGTAFNRAEIVAAARAARVTIRAGDVVLFHTGWMAAHAESNPQGFVATQPGLGREGADYLASLGVVMVGADTAALEAIPFENANQPFIVHQTLLTRRGVYILENINTAELARDGATQFMFVLGQPRFQGSVQAVVNPIAIR